MTLLQDSQAQAQRETCISLHCEKSRGSHPACRGAGGSSGGKISQMCAAMTGHLEGRACSLHAALRKVELCQHRNVGAGCAGCCADRAQACPDVPLQGCGVSLQFRPMPW